MNAWFANLDDRLNPILVKEIRQSLRGRSALLVIGAALIVQLLALYLFAINTDAKDLGAGFFKVILTVFIFGSFILIAVFCQRFSLEKRESDLDLACITTLSPWQIVIGKFVSALVMELMLFSLCLPFMVMSYYLGGIDLSSILLRSAILLLLMLPCIMLGLLIGASGKKSSVVLFVLMFFFLYGYAMAVLEMVARFDFMPMIVAGVLWSLGFLGVLTLAAVGNINSNRVRGLRIYIAVSAFVAFPLFYYLCIMTMQCKGDGFGSQYFDAIILFAGLLLLTAAVEPGMPSRRILAEVRSPNVVIYWLKRLFAGSAVSGFLLGLLLLAIGAAGRLAAAPAAETSAYTLVGVGCYMVFYSGFTIFLNRLIEHWTLRFSGVGCLIVTGILFCALPGFISSLARPDLERLARPPWELWGSVFSLNFRDGMFCFYISLGFALAGLLFAVPSMVAYFQLKKE